MVDPAGGENGDTGPTPEAEPTTVSVARYSGLGLQWALAVALFMAAGRWLDKRIGTDPYLTVVGAFVGGAAGFYSLYVGLVKGQRTKGSKG